MLMFAYGSNLNLEQMARRCPKAIPLGRQRVPDRRLVFRGVADCIADPGAVCYGGVWRITPDCEAALDIYEGVRAEGGMYRKEYIPIKPMPDGEDALLVYVMNSTGIFPPSAYYLSAIREGYRDFKLPNKAHVLLKHAVRDAWDDKAPTHIERRRHMRNGRPRLAQAPSPAMLATGKQITLALKKE